MLKQGTFINKKYNMLFWEGIWGSLTYCINLMSDAVISGNRLGEVALQAVTIVYPLFSVVLFFAHLMSLGDSVLFGRAMGEFDRKKSSRIAGTAIISSAIVGLLLPIALWFIKEPFLNYYGCTGELYTKASAYYNWLIPYSFLQCLACPIYYLVVTDGEAALISVADISNFFAHIIFSVILSRIFGISGIGMANCIGLLFSINSFLVHFLKKSNSVKFHVCLDWKTVGQSFILSASDYMSYLFLAIVGFVMNKIIISDCGHAYIPAYSVINLAFGLCQIYGASIIAGRGLITCFFGERNSVGFRSVCKKIQHSILILSVCLMLFLFFGAPLIPAIYGLQTPATIDAAIYASRIMAFTAPGFGLCYYCCGISAAVGKSMQALFISFLNDMLSPLLLSLILGSLWSFSGIAVGMCLSTYFAFGLYALVQILHKGKDGFPLYMEGFDENCFSYDLYVTPDSITELRGAVCKELSTQGYNPSAIDLLLEAFFARVTEKNHGKAVLAECTLLPDEATIRVITRDNGTLFDFADEVGKTKAIDASASDILLSQIKEKNYELTTSFNCNNFVFQK